MADGERRLAAIMFTDIVGYTHLSQTNESLALELLEEHQRLLRPAFAAHGGTEVKTMGDAFLVEFKSALQAVMCAVEIQKKMAERNAAAPPSRKLELRIGIHVGDVVNGAGDIYGDAVNVASRIEPLAEPGGVCISQQVFDQIRNKTPLEIDKVGDVNLKNVYLPVGIYKIGLTGSRASAEQLSGPKERLAVLPFVNISPDPNDEYFADGLTEELIAKLSEVKGLKVIARTSVMNYKRKEKKVSEIAAELRVGSVIEGSVRKAGDRIRISVQLIDPRTEEHLWSSNYDSKLGRHLRDTERRGFEGRGGAFGRVLLPGDAQGDRRHRGVYLVPQGDAALLRYQRGEHEGNADPPPAGDREGPDFRSRLRRARGRVAYERGHGIRGFSSSRQERRGRSGKGFGA